MIRTHGPRDWRGRIAVWIALLVLIPALASAGEKKKAAAKEEEYKPCNVPAQQCIDYMWKKMKSTGWVGIELSYEEGTKEYTIERVLPTSPAEEGGLKAGDVMLAMNEVTITGLDGKALSKVVRRFQAGDSMTYTIRRDGAQVKISLTLAPMPAHLLAQYIGEHLHKHHPEVAAGP